ncbi:MAG: DUF1638 domain-containing protein [Clostridia bacterium]|nr:DUF1638 domain-containing protein [Clostridia bacterium]MBS3969993.1 DUF1638 domain-containing protein [Clostridia bacterium]
MAKNIVIACNALRDEINLVVNELQINYPIIWVDAGLHNHPSKLKDELQKLINNIDNVDNILLLFGNCGNSVLGLKSEKASIILPRVDDCISLLLGGNEHKAALDQKGTSYYLTKGYLHSGASMWTEYLNCIDKYGYEKSLMIFKTMLVNYKGLRLIDTGAYELDDIRDTFLKMAKEFGLEPETVPGTIRTVYKAFKKEWDEEFIVVKPGQPV